MIYHETEHGVLYCGDCLDILPTLEVKADMILCDLPYGVLNKGNPSAKWDTIIPFAPLWLHYTSIIKDSGVIALTSQGMFTAELMISNKKLWKYNLIWDKVSKTGFLNSSKMPLRQHEDVSIFYKCNPTYNPQMDKCLPHKRNHTKGNMKSPTKNNCYGSFVEVPTTISDLKYPTSIISISKEHSNGSFFHPTQKPVALFGYLIKTYTNEGELVLDNCAGSGTTAISCIRYNRRYILIEKEEKYCEIAKQRIVKELDQLRIEL